MKEGEFKAVISTMGVIDRQSDLVLPGAFGRQEVLISQYNHGSWERGVDALPLGIATIHEEGNEAIALGEFDLEDEAARKTWNMMKYLHSKGRRQEFSYALPDIEFENQTIGGERIRVLKKIRVQEISPVLMGASIGTRLLDIKAAQSATPRRKLFAGPCVLGDDSGALALWETREILAKYSRPADSPLALEQRAQLDEIRQHVEELGRQVQDSMMQHFSEVDLADAAPEVQAIAGKALETFSAWLGIAWPVKLRWFLPENLKERAYVRKYRTYGWRDWEGFEIDEPVVGLTKRAADYIWIHAGRDQVDTVETIAHELVHVADTGQSLSHEEVFLRARQLMQAFYAASPR